MVVKTPDSVRASRLKGISEDEFAPNIEIAGKRLASLGMWMGEAYLRFDNL